MNNGKLIVLEGIDGSGKSAQYRRLCSRFEEEGIAFRHIVFPRYDQESSALIRMYLGGAFGERPADVNAYAASTFWDLWLECHSRVGDVMAERFRRPSGPRTK